MQNWGQKSHIYEKSRNKTEILLSEIFELSDEKLQLLAYQYF